ncbi:MAG: L,D-transpeptidase family protein [Alphaproteobacteria bacterium]|nr:L,D-transpeptidase family protein [Alphaproteobacteria bacterium]
MPASRQAFRTRFGAFCLALVLLCGAPRALLAATYAIEEGEDVVGEQMHYAVEANDTLYDVARRFDLGIVELLAANPDVDPWIPGEGAELVLPTRHVLPPAAREGIVINLAELRLYYFPDPDAVMTFPIGIGSEGWQTPEGQTSVVRKRKDPAWIPPPSIRREEPGLPAFFPPGPDNPMGSYALDLGWEGYRIHGTNKPYGIGSRSSHGCIRLYPEDIEPLFAQVRTGEPVTVIDARYKLGWSKGELWLEVTPTQQQADVVADYKEPEAIDIPGIYSAIEDMGAETESVNWYVVDEAINHPGGIPVAVAGRERP